MRANKMNGMRALVSLVISILFLASIGCGPPSSSGGAGQPTPSSTEIPELTDDVIRERLNYTRVREIPPEDGLTGEPISWRFFEEEPKEITVVQKQMDGVRATITLDIKTQSTPRAREPRALAGRILTEWELKTGWVLRKWEVVKTENISMKYRNLPKAPAENSNADRGRS